MEDKERKELETMLKDRVLQQLLTTGNEMEPAKTLESMNPDDEGQIDVYGLNLVVFLRLVEFEARKKAPCFFQKKFFGDGIDWRVMGYDIDLTHDEVTNTWTLYRRGELDLVVDADEYELLNMNNKKRKELTPTQMEKWDNLANKFIPDYYPQSVKQTISRKISGTDPRTGLSHGQIYNRWN